MLKHFFFFYFILQFSVSSTYLLTYFQPCVGNLSNFGHLQLDVNSIYIKNKFQSFHNKKSIPYLIKWYLSCNCPDKKLHCLLHSHMPLKLFVDTLNKSHCLYFKNMSQIRPFPTPPPCFFWCLKTASCPILFTFILASKMCSLEAVHMILFKSYFDYITTLGTPTANSGHALTIQYVTCKFTITRHVFPIS